MDICTVDMQTGRVLAFGDTMTLPIDAAFLQQCGIAGTEALAFEDPLRYACGRFAINTPQRFGAFLGQAMVESDCLKTLEENLYYTSAQRICEAFPAEVTSIGQAERLVQNPRALALTAYSGRLGNGTWASGDGWTFRGRGIFQVTGRNNYHDAAVGLGRPYLEQPELLSMPADAALSAAWYWHTIHGNELADAGQWAAITRAVNGPAMLQAGLREQQMRHIAEVLSAEMGA